MNPLVASALGAILRWALAFVAGWLVQHNIWTSADASTYVAAGSMALLGLLWSLWNKYRGRIKLLTALTMAPGATEQDVKDHISSGASVPAAMTKTTDVPVLLTK